MTIDERGRRKLTEESGKLEGKFDHLEAKEREAFIRNLSMRDRLMRRVKTTKIPLKLKDDLGEFTIYSRLLTSGEREKAFYYNALLAQSQQEPERYGKALKGFRELAKDINITDELGLDFWESPDVS